MKLRPPKSNRKRRSKLFLPIFILLIMVLSIFGVIIFSPQGSETFEYKGKTFVTDLNNGGYFTRVNDQKITFLYDPRELEKVKSTPVTLTQLNYANKFYISINPEQDIGLAIIEFNRLVAPLLNKRIVTSCFEDVSGCEDLLIITCEEATPEAKVIIYEQAELPSMDYNLNCLTIKGSGEDLARMTNKIALDFLFS